MSPKPPSNLYPPGLRDLRVYQLARQLANLVFDATSKVVKEDQESYDF